MFTKDTVTKRITLACVAAVVIGTTSQVSAAYRDDLGRDGPAQMISTIGSITTTSITSTATQCRASQEAHTPFTTAAARSSITEANGIAATAEFRW